MKKALRCVTCFLIAVFLTAGCLVPVSYAAEEDVQSVISQLEAIDTLQQMQDKRSTFKANGHYNFKTTDDAIIQSHLAAQSAYQTYVSEMFAARLAAQQAYDALTDAEKAMIDPALVAKLSNYLPTTLDTTTLSLSTVMMNLGSIIINLVNGIIVDSLGIFSLYRFSLGFLFLWLALYFGAWAFGVYVLKKTPPVPMFVQRSIP